MILTNGEKNQEELLNYKRTEMQKEMVIQKLKQQGYRITKQRLILLDIILEQQCSCCKEIYYRVSRLNPKIGISTIYRMVNTLEQIGAISRENTYRVVCDCEIDNACIIKLDDNTVYHLSTEKLNLVILAGLKAFGYVDKQNIKNIVIRSCSCSDNI